MITFVVAFGLAGAGLQGGTAPVMPRKNFGNCISKFVQDKAGDKMEPDAFKAALKIACAKQESDFRTSWIAYEVSMKTKRADAEQNATSQIDDYFQNAVETYSEMNEPPKPKS